MKKLISLFLALCLTLGLGVTALADNAPADSAPAPDKPGTLSFENLESRMRTSCASVMALEEGAATVDSIDYTKMFEQSKDSLEKLADSLFFLSGDPTMAGFTSSLKSAQESLADSLEDMSDGTFRRDNELTKHQMHNLANQVICGAQKLYISICTYEQQLSDAERSLAALDRALTAAEKSFQLGQISALQLQQLRSSRASAASKIETLRMAIANMKSSLLSMLGEDPSGSLQLMGLPEVPEASVAAMNYEADLAAATEKSYDLHSADVVLARAKETWEDSAEDFHYGNFVGDRYRYDMALHTWQAAQYTNTSAHQSFTLSFLTAYRAVSNAKQVLDAAQTALEYQKQSFLSSQTQFNRGMISANDLKDAEDALATAESAVFSAKVDYFTAWNTYSWLVRTGLSASTAN